MKIHIDEITESGLELVESCRPSDLDLDREDIRFAEPINLSARITKRANFISVELRIDGLTHLDCSRCLEEFTTPLSKQIELNLAVKNKDIVDITDNVREEIILGYPLKPLCRADCRGLCPNCGQNLNKEKCSCKKQE